MIRSLTTFSAILLMALAPVPTASAAVIDCTGSWAAIADRVDSSSGCQVSDQTNDTPQPDLANSEEFFGFDDWSFDGKFPEGSPLLVSFTGDGDAGTAGSNGTWRLDDPDTWDSYSELMFIFKDGAGTTLVGYLLTSADGLSGTWTTPFTNPPFEGVKSSKQTSHISVYYRDGSVSPAEVPEPASLLLLGSGLAGVGALRRRRRA